MKDSNNCAVFIENGRTGELEQLSTWVTEERAISLLKSPSYFRDKKTVVLKQVDTTTDMNTGGESDER